MSLLDLVVEKRPEILRIAAKHGARNLRLIGSVARGQEHRTSDVDFLADVDVGQRQPLQDELEQLLGIDVDVVAAPHKYLRDGMLRDAVPLEFSDFREQAVLQSRRRYEPLDRDAAYLRLMLDHCRDVVEISDDTTREAFLSQRVPQYSLMTPLMLIGEHAGRVSAAFQTSHPDIPWKNIRDFRNVLVHDYPGLDLEHVWDETIQRAVPELMALLEPLVSG